MIFLSDGRNLEESPKPAGAFFMEESHFISDDELNQYRQAFDRFMGFSFNAPVFRPTLGLEIGQDGRLSISAAKKERMALKYLWERIQKGRDYISLRLMARDLGFTLDDCERLVATAHAERKIPRLTIIEEVEG